MKLDNVIATRPQKTVYREGDAVIKVFSEEYSKAEILNEALNQARVEETDLPIARVREVTKIDGKWAIVSDYIEGKTLTQLMRENPERREEYLALFVDLQRQIHAQKCPLLTVHQDKMHRKISQAQLDATTRYELHTRLEGMPRHHKVLHGDFHPSNVIVTPDGDPYIIDWAHVTQGNAGADAARTYLVLWLSGDEQLAKDYLRLYCQKTDTARQYVEKWLPIVAASQSVKGNPEERDLLLKWADVVDFE